jgi:uncharacterized protein involved in outer membrane biogenesis
MLHRSLKWLAALLLALPLLAILYVALFGWNWARGPLQHIALEKTGRELVIGGDLKVSLGWPSPRVRANTVSFANPPWAKEKRMVAVDDMEFTVDLLALLRKHLVFPEVRMTRPVVFLELAADGRKTWLLDLDQSDETARILIGRLTLDHGRLGYDDAKQKTSIRSDISTQDMRANSADATGVVFSADGLYKGLALAAHGSGGSVLALYDEKVPYPLQVDATVGHTGIKADGTVTSLFKFSAMDMHLALRGDSLAQLYPLFGIAVPETHPFAIAGRIILNEQMWRYEKFSGHMGKSDFAGTLQAENGGVRPFVHGDVVSQLLNFDDLGPIIGAKEQRPAPAVHKSRAPGQAAGATNKAVALAPAAIAGPHVLPDIPFKTERWNSVDADVTLHAKTILRAKELPLENLVTHLKMQNSLLTLDPIDFGFAGGHLKAVISLDGRQKPIQARARIGARKILLAKLFPTVDLAKTSIGQINGEFDLAGKGNSVGRMLATSNGRVGLIVENGEISKLLMEKIGLHLLEILQLKISGDKTIKLRCGVADFGVKKGVMEVNALVLDTEVSTIIGTGTIDLAQEKYNLTLVPKTRDTSPVALRSPIYIRGTFSNPEVNVDTGRVAARGARSLLLGLINPLLALIPLVEMGPGIESECGRLIHETHMPLHKQPQAPTSSSPK